MPIDTITTMSVLAIKPDDTNSTCFASMCKSGSAIEMKKPRIIPAIPIIQILLDFVITSPIRLPSGVIPISTPNKNIDNPMIIINVPKRNLITNGNPRGAIVKFNINTIIVIGNTAKITSLNLFVIKFKHFTSFS